MTTWTSRTVDQFRPGDRIRVHGWEGRVSEVEHVMMTADKDGYHTTNPKYIEKEVACTYLRVRFDEPEKIGAQYDGGWYGGLDGVVAYGYGSETPQAGNGIMKHSLEYIVRSWIFNLDVPLYEIGMEEATDYATYITPDDTDDIVTPEAILALWNQIVNE